MYEYLHWHDGWAVEVHMHHDTPFIISGVLGKAAEDCLVVNHHSGAQYVIPLASIRMVKLEPLTEPASGEE